MKVIRDFDSVEYDRNSIVTVGTFDGVHIGHRKIINMLTELKSGKTLRRVVVTFEPHPQLVLKNKTKELKILSTLEEKSEIFEKLGVDMVYVINFTKEFSMNTAEQFYTNYLIKKVGFSDIVIGYDHMVGRNRSGGFETLTKLSGEYNFEIHKIDELRINGNTISSSAIRTFLTERKVKEASRLLPDYYSITGEVVSGDKLGRKIGFPTANIKPASENKLIPGNGVYLVSAEISGNLYYGLLNIGFRPTVTEIPLKTIEVYFMDFEGDIYGKTLRIKFRDFIREEKKFNSIEVLINQIKKDEEFSKTLITKINN
jgi:riboflavin kinase / FMN adenylyltransferase